MLHAGWMELRWLRQELVVAMVGCTARIGCATGSQPKERFWCLIELRMSGLLRLLNICLAVMVFAAGVPAFARQAPVVDPAYNRQGAALPKQFGKWTSGPGPADEPKLVAPNSEVLKEAGQANVEVERYTDGKKWLRVWLQEFRDPSAAYEAYTAQLNPSLNPSTVAPLTAAGNDQIVALVGNRLVTIVWVRNASDADLKLLLGAVKQGADGTPLPPIRGYLPDEGLLQGTQRYALGPAGFNAALESMKQNRYQAMTQEIGFASGAEAMLAQYDAGRGKTQSLVIIDYPTPQLAEQRLRHIQAALAANVGADGVAFERKGSLLSAVLAPASVQAAANLREAIRYQTSVTWNEPSQTLTDPPWLLVVKNIFLGTLAFCGVAIVLGIAFGGVRVITKRLFPGRVFDRPENMEVLQLGLSGKRIDPRDFY